MFVYLSSIFIFGLIIGSFISAVTYRIPRGLDFIKGRSFCDSCKKNLFWYDNIPLISFVIYKGKSRCCGRDISIRYPLIELTSAIGLISLYLLFPQYNFIVYGLLFFLTLSIFIIDLEYQIIPDELTWIVFFWGLLFVNGSPFTFLFSAFVFGFSILIINLLTKGRGMGLGDVKLAVALGFWLALENGATWLMTSFIIGGIVSALLLLLKKATMKTKVAFGPFLIVGFWIVLILNR